MATYEEAGVHVDAGAEAVRRIRSLVESTYKNGSEKVLIGVGGFCFVIESSDGSIEGFATDGVGTKALIAAALGKYDTIGIDLVAMNANDLAVHGITPEYFTNDISVGKQIPDITVKILEGIVRGCHRAGMVIAGGEMAEMPDMYYKNEYFTLSGTAKGSVSSKELLVTGRGIKPGMKVFGFPSSGVHANGFSLIRRSFIHANARLSTMRHILSSPIDELEMTLGEELLKPTLIYVSLIRNLCKRYDIKGMAHITGGGWYGNMPRMLPDGCAIEIKHSSWEIPPIFPLIQKRGSMSTEEMFRTFNMGVGLMVISPDTIPEGILIGRVVKEKEKVVHFLS